MVEKKYNVLVKVGEDTIRLPQRRAFIHARARIEGDPAAGADEDPPNSQTAAGTVFSAAGPPKK